MKRLLFAIVASLMLGVAHAVPTDVNVVAFGARCNGTGDDGPAFAKAIAAVMGSQGAIRATGGSIYVPAGATCVLTTNPFGVLPNDGTLGAPPAQASLRIFGAGADASSTTGGLSGKQASKIDFKYSTTNNAKIDTRGKALLEIDHLVLTDSSGNSEPFIFTSNTVILIHDNLFLGSKIGVLADQDGIVLGGTGTALDQTANAAFQGYGSQIYNNNFHRIRRAVYARVFANGVPIHHNTVWADCGFTAGAAFDYDGDPTAAPPVQIISGTPLRDNLVELTNYKYAVRMRGVQASTVGPNDFYDPTATTTASYNLTDGALYMLVLGGWHPDSKPFVSETGTAANSNSWVNQHQSQESRLLQNLTFGGNTNTRPKTLSGAATAWMLGGQNSAGDLAEIYYAGAAVGQWVVQHTPSGGAAQTLLAVKDFGTGTTIDLQLQGTATRITSAASLIQLQSPVQVNSTMAWSGAGTITKVRGKSSAALDFPNTVSGAASDLTIALTGAVVGDAVWLGIPNGSIVAGAAGFYAWVSAADTVKVRFWNASGGALDPASGTFTVWVVQ